MHAPRANETVLEHPDEFVRNMGEALGATVDYVDK